MLRTRAAARGVGSVFLCCLLLSACRSPSVVERAEELWAAGEVTEARRLLTAESRSSEAALLRLAELEGGHFDEYLHEGDTALEAKDLDRAYVAYENALAVIPQHPDALRGLAVTLARLHQRNAARESFASSCAGGDWREAWRTAAQLRLSDLEVSPRGFGSPIEREQVFDAVRGKLLALLSQEIDRAIELGALDLIETRLAELSAVMAVEREGLSDLSPEWQERHERWSRTLNDRRRAQDYFQAAAEELSGGDERLSWRKVRLAHERHPDDPEIAATERALAETFRARALTALEQVKANGDPQAAMLALEWIDELGTGWPDEGALTREQLHACLAEAAEERAWRAETSGQRGRALFEWIDVLRLSRGEEARDAETAIDRLRREILAVPLIRRVNALTIAPAAPAPETRFPTETLVVVLPEREVAESVEQTRVAESVGWVRTGVCESPRPGRDCDLRRLGRAMVVAINLRDAWLAMPPARASLGERRLRFQLSEIERLADRLLTERATEERGVWRAEEVELTHERRSIRVTQLVTLTRLGEALETTEISVEESIAGRIPEGETPSTDTPIFGGEAEAKRLRQKLEERCGTQLEIYLNALRLEEIDRLERRAHEWARAGELDRAIEAMARAWLHAPDSHSRARRELWLTAWLGREPLWGDPISRNDR